MSVTSGNRPAISQPTTSSLRTFLVRGISNLAVATAVERILGFTANSLAARAAGPQMYGAYSVVLTTANLFSTYAGAGIGSTANRFGGQYPPGSPGHDKLVRHLMVSSILSVALAVTLMLLSARLIALAVLKAPHLEVVLRWAAIATGLSILIECFRGLFIGERRFRPLLISCSLTAALLALLLPIAARMGTEAMVKAQIAASLAGVGAAAIFVCTLVRPFRRNAVSSDGGPRLKKILLFGLAQLGGTAGLSITSWWMSVLLARSDPSFQQVGFYSVSNQARVLLAIGPAMLGQIIYSSLTNEGGQPFGGPQRITRISTYLNSIFVVALLACLVPIVTRLISFVYGRGYHGCEMAVTLSMATAAVQTCGLPAALRLSVVSIGAFTVVNIAWTGLVFLCACLLVPTYGAAGAAAAWLIGYTCCQLLVVTCLRWKGESGRELMRLSCLVFLTAIAVSVFGFVQQVHPELTLPALLASAVVPAGAVAVMIRKSRLGIPLHIARFWHAGQRAA